MSDKNKYFRGDSSVTYRFFSIILFLIFILNAVISYGKAPGEMIWKTTSNDFVILFQEDDKFVTQQIEISDKTLQKIKETKFFKTKDAAIKFIKTKNIVETKKSDLYFSNLQSELNDENIWPTVNSWNWEWELKFAEWTKENFNQNYFYDHKIKTDCADAAIALRWIFSRIHFLPAAQTLVVSDRIFSNESMKSEWLELPTSEKWNEDKRFLAALDYVLDNTYTHSLYRDSYPILIDKAVLTIGTHLMQLTGQGGHTLIVSQYERGTLYTLSSNVPKKIRKLAKASYTQLFAPKYDVSGIDGGGGFVRMRWPLKNETGFELQARDKMPFYSLEQYSKEFMGSFWRFSDAVYQRMGDVQTPMTKYQSTLETLLTLYRDRVEIVEEGFTFCAANNCDENTQNYDNYSTPNRDLKIQTTIDNLKNLIEMYGYSEPEIATSWNEESVKVVVAVEGHDLTLQNLIDIWSESKYSYDPRSPILKRWGIPSEIRSAQSFQK